MRWPSWLPRAPSLVAEALAEVRDPLAAWLRAGPPAPPRAVAGALAGALLPPVADDEPPPWLRPEQGLSFRRALAAVRRHGGALLADPVGTGKTYIALAVAAALDSTHPIQVIGPAALRQQWREVAARLGLGIAFHSHEALSRGRVPPCRRGAIVVDESHRFRHPATRRYSELAPWCVGRRGILVSATPAVNRLEDVAHQLLLLVRDDALAWSGVPSLRRGLGGGGEALAHLIVTGEDRAGLLPVRSDRELRPLEPPGSPFHRLAAGIGRLRLSRDVRIAGLVRVVLLQALGSSPAAVAEALSRYRALLRHARDAALDGRTVSRDAIRRMVGREAEQLVFWPLLGADAAPAELALDDLEAVESLEEEARRWRECPDARVAALRALLAEPRPTLVFTTATATVRYLRRHLAPRGIAWCTGHASGLDRAAVPREAVLDWFRRPVLGSDAALSRPRVLVATDVAAEGLDLPLVERVVHYDLPWTAVRLEQRSGRAFRLGARHAAAEVVTCFPAPEIEAALRTRAILDGKAGLPAELGLGSARSAPWRLRAEIAARWQDRSAAEGVASIRGAATGAVAGFRIRAGDGSAREVVMARTGAGWTYDLAAVSGMLDTAAAAVEPVPLDAARLRGVLRGLSAQARIALRIAQGAGLVASHRTAAVHRLRRRLLAAARRAVRLRDEASLAAVERGLALLRRGQTAGEARLATAWDALAEPALLAALSRLPREEPPPAPVSVEVIGVLLVLGRERSG